LTIRRFTIPQALKWIGCGWRIWKKNLLFWWILGTLYVLFVFLVTRIPFLGTFVILLLAPTMTAGVLATVCRQLNPKGEHTMRYLLKRAKSPQAKLAVLMGGPAKALFSGFTDEHRILPLMGMGLATAVLGVLIQIVSLNIGGAFFHTADTLAGVGFVQGLRMAAAYLVTFLMYLALVVVYIYLIALYVIDDRPLADAAGASIRACARNAVPCSVYAGVLVLPMLAAGLLLQVSLLAGLGAMLIVGGVVLPLLINSAYCTSRLMYR